jgi:flagellar biosynthesis GTPase FlhF
VKGWIYLRKDPGRGYAIGKTTDEKNRERNYRKENPHIVTVDTFYTHDIVVAENELKRLIRRISLFPGDNRRNEWAKWTDDIFPIWKDVKRRHQNDSYAKEQARLRAAKAEEAKRREAAKAEEAKRQEAAKRIAKELADKTARAEWQKRQQSEALANDQQIKRLEQQLDGLSQRNPYPPLSIENVFFWLVFTPQSFVVCLLPWTIAVELLSIRGTADEAWLLVVLIAAFNTYVIFLSDKSRREKEKDDLQRELKLRKGK